MQKNFSISIQGLPYIKNTSQFKALNNYNRFNSNF